MTDPLWFLYVLRCADGSLYTGITNNLDRRLTIHNRGKASKYTRARLPVEMVAHVPVGCKSDALKLEIKFKKLSRTAKLTYVENGLIEFLNMKT